MSTTRRTQISKGKKKAEQQEKGVPKIKVRIAGIAASTDYVISMSAYRVCVHTEYVCIQSMSAYRVCQHTEYVCIQSMSAYRVCQHTEYVCIQSMSAYRVCQHTKVVRSCDGLKNTTNLLGSD
jgi:hypothetical protein